MPTERVIAIVLFLVSGWLVLRLAPPAIVSWRIYAGTGSRRQQDATGRAPEPRSEVAARMERLGALGYHPLGATGLVLPVGERFARIMAADDAESYAIVVDGTTTAGLTGIYSAWMDGTWLGTQHPRGEPVARPDLTVQVVGSSLDDAVAAHRAGLARLRAAHGEPRRIERMPDMLALDADYRTRFGGSRLRPLVIRAIAPAVAATVIACLSFLLAIASS